MQPQPATIFGLSRGSVRRSLWLLLGLAHLPALFGTLQTLATDGFSADRLAPCLLLALAIVFFALKTWDVAALRFRTDRRSCVTLIIVVAMLHLDVLRPESGQTRVPM
ncbi:MAG: hypothetical protein ACE5EX_02780, partial [Phycisphaerae bacterium]